MSRLIPGTKRAQMRLGARLENAQRVLRGLQEYVDQFSTRIRDANK